MPPGWDDSIIDKIKTGESNKKILAVLDFEGNEKLKGKVLGCYCKPEACHGDIIVDFLEGQ